MRRGQKGAPVVFWKIVGKGDEVEEAAKPMDQAATPHPTALVKTSCVFNAAQVDGFNRPPKEITSLALLNATAESLITACGATIHHGKSSAFYDPVYDKIWLPHKAFFKESAGYYSVAFHELTHWTGHENRCSRDLKGRFGSESYAMEELVAELGAAFLCAEVGLSTKPRPDHAQYIQSWLRVLKSDTRAVFTAASKATQASAFLLQSSSVKSQSQ